MNSYDASGRKLAARNFTNVVALSQPLNEGEVLKHVVDENERVYISSVHNIDNVEYNSLTSYNFSTASAVESIQFSKLYNSEGYVAESSTSTNSQLNNPEYYYFCRDHLGNIREVWRGNRRTVVQRTQYYPSGLPWAKNTGDDTELPANANNRKYNGKEWVEMHGLDEYDYHARGMYPAIMRFTTVDPLAEKKPWLTPYHFCSNNPLNRLDPDGRDDFTINKKTGDVKLIEQNDNPDRILKTNRKGEIKYNKKGEAKVAVGGIEQGILKDGQNFKNKDQVISVGGEGQPTVKGVEDFSLKLSEYVGTEIAGAYFSKDGAAATTHISIGNYKNNTLRSANGHGHREGIKQGLKLNDITGFYHTHPSTGISVSDRTRASEGDIKARDNALKLMPHMKFFIITSPLYYGADNEKINYTNH